MIYRKKIIFLKKSTVYNKIRYKKLKMKYLMKFMKN